MHVFKFYLQPKQNFDFMLTSDGESARFVAKTTANNLPLCIVHIGAKQQYMSIQELCRHCEQVVIFSCCALCSVYINDISAIQGSNSHPSGLLGSQRPPTPS